MTPLLNLLDYLTTILNIKNNSLTLVATHKSYFTVTFPLFFSLANDPFVAQSGGDGGLVGSDVAATIWYPFVMNPNYFV